MARPCQWIVTLSAAALSPPSIVIFRPPTDRANSGRSAFDPPAAIGGAEHQRRAGSRRARNGLRRYQITKPGDGCYPAAAARYDRAYDAGRAARAKENR